MRRRNTDDLWTFSEAKPVTLKHKFFLLVLVIAGVINIAFFADWWFREEHIGNLWLFVLLSLILYPLFDPRMQLT